MARTNGSLTKATTGNITPVTGKITRRQETAPVQLEAQALLFEEFRLHFDPDLQAQILEMIINNQSTVNQEYNEFRSLAKTLELSRLAAQESGREQGIQEARAEYVQKAKAAKLAAQQKFISIDLPNLINKSQYLGFENMKILVNQYAARLGVQVEFSIEGNDITYTPSIIGNDLPDRATTAEPEV